jgi:hypothetical protein
LDSGTTRVVETDARGSGKDCLIHDLANLLGKSFGKRSSEDCKVLGECVSDASVDVAVTSDNTITIDLLVLHAEIVASVSDQLVVLDEAAWVEK